MERYIRKSESLLGNLLQLTLSTVHSQHLGHLPLPNRFSVTTYTSDVRGAGTNGRVWIGIVGEYGQLGGKKIELDSTGDNFERGREDVFLLQFPGRVGSLKKVLLLVQAGALLLELRISIYAESVLASNPKGNFVNWTMLSFGLRRRTSSASELHGRGGIR